jgi:hypothetical protein
MVRKIILQLLIYMVIILTLTSAFVITIVYINKGKPEKKDKLYEINATHGGIVQTIAYYLVKPIVESALDCYIEKHGLAEYLEGVTQQTEEQSINFYEITEGNGNEAFCGQEILLQMYKIPSNNLATPPLLNQASDMTLKIGQDNLKEMSLGVIGMKEGGERVITVNNLTNNNNMNFNSYYVKLIEIKDQYPSSMNNLMIFNNSVSNSGKQVKCGEKISVSYNIRQHNGEFIIKNRTVQFKIGDRKVPLAIELGVIGMRAGNNRVIISPPDLLNITENMLIKDIDFNKENVSIIDLSIEQEIQNK